MAHHFKRNGNPRLGIGIEIKLQNLRKGALDFNLGPEDDITNSVNTFFHSGVVEIYLAVQATVILYTNVHKFAKVSG